MEMWMYNIEKGNRGVEHERELYCLRAKNKY